MITISLKGYAPDLDPTIPGIFTAASAMVPSMRGMKAAPSAADVGLDALAAASQGAVVIRKLDASTRFFAGSATKLYENASGTTWTDRTRAVGGDYALSTDNRWRFAQFGDTTYAAAKSDTLQSSASGAFANVTGAPKAAIVETVGQFLMLLDTNDATYGDSADRWWCSALGDPTDWTVAPSTTQAATGRLTSSPGPIRGGKRLGNDMIVYKDRAIFRGTYVGPPVVWDWVEVSDSVGAPCQEAIVPISTESGGQAHIFIGFEDFYYYDGSRPVPLKNPVKKTFFDAVSKSFLYRCHAVHDRTNSLIYFYFVSTAAGTIDSCFVYNYRRDTWGRDDRTIEVGVEYITTGMSYDAFGTTYATYDTTVAVSYDSPYWVSGYPLPAVFNGSHKVVTLTGVAGDSSFTLSELGDDDAMSLIRRIRPRYLTAPSSATLQNAYRMISTDAYTNDTTTTINNGKFDVMREARWHKLTHTANGACELNVITADIEKMGDE